MEEARRSIAFPREVVASFGIRDGWKTWNDIERASLALIQGVIWAKWARRPTDSLAALSTLKTAISFFGPDRLPQRQQAGEAFFETGKAFDTGFGQEKGRESQAMGAYLTMQLRDTRSDLFKQSKPHLRRFGTA